MNLTTYAVCHIFTGGNGIRASLTLHGYRVFRTVGEATAKFGRVAVATMTKSRRVLGRES